jgi:peptidoglycan/xylan/chitin deacetylase (PgdA/CDA1 family)
MYHRIADARDFDQLTVSTRRFAEQIALLASRYRVLSLDAALDELESGVRTPGVAVTFDDGYLDNLTNAIPVLRMHGVPATIFVTANFCDQTQRHPRYATEPDAASRLHLDWDEVLEIDRDPLFRIGSHTLSHPYLSRLNDTATWQEISASRRAIEEHLGHRVDTFCYPSGDRGIREREMAVRAGYRAAVSVAPGQNGSGADLFGLRRTEVTDNDGVAELSNKLAGAWDLPHRYLHWRRTARFNRAARGALSDSNSGISN